MHARLCTAYAKRCGALWRADAAARWLHAGAARLVAMHESYLFAADLTMARAKWRESQVSLCNDLQKDYIAVNPEDGASENPPIPPTLRRAAEARLLPNPLDHAQVG